MRFYVEFKRPEIGDDQLWEYKDDDIIPWTPEYKILLEANRQYRQQRNQGEGEASDSVINLLKSITEIKGLFENLDDCHFYISEENDLDEKDRFLLQQMRERSTLKDQVTYLNLYPNLEGKTYHSSEVSMARVSFEKDLDLEMIARNQKGITKENLFQLLPKCKWLSGFLELPITMTPEQIAIEEENHFGFCWHYMQRDVYFYIAGIEMNVFLGGSKHFSREKT